MEDPSPKDNSPRVIRVIRVLEALKQASHDLQAHPTPNSDEFNSSAIRALLELETESDTIHSKDPNLSTLSNLLARLKTLIFSLQKSRGHSLKSYLNRRLTAYSVSRLAGSIESEIQAWIDREIVENLTKALTERSTDEDELIKLLTKFQNRLSQGFNRELQDLILKSKVFSLFESILCDSNSLKRVREHIAYAIGALIAFNKDVFVGQVLSHPTIHALITMSSIHSIKVLCDLIRLIKSPLVDEIESNGEISKIISFLSSRDMEIQVLAMDCILEIGYFGRKEAVEAMIKEGLIEKLVELQISELGGDLIEMERYNEDEEKNKRGVSVSGVVRKRERREKSYLENHPFASCVARFAVQLEVGEGLRQREKRAFKLEILNRVKMASVSEAKAATIMAEVLWGSMP